MTAIEPADRRVLVLYDADCGICTHTARILRRLDRVGRLDLMPLQVAAGRPDTPSLEVLLGSIHVRGAGEAWSAGGAAMVRISREIRVLRPFGVLAGLPLLRRLVELAYAFVASNRHRISGLFGIEACAVDPPQAR